MSGTIARITQVGDQVAFEPSQPTARVTQVATQVAFEPTIPAARVTQTGIQVAIDIAIYPPTGRRFFVVAT
jgi:hypothetical protein